jgi:hypothetical protein
VRATDNSEREGGAIVPTASENASLAVGTPHRLSGLSARQLLPSEIELALIMRDEYNTVRRRGEAFQRMECAMDRYLQSASMFEPAT